jgi:hypothetical protein
MVENYKLFTKQWFECDSTMAEIRSLIAGLHNNGYILSHIECNGSIFSDANLSSDAIKFGVGNGMYIYGLRVFTVNENLNKMVRIVLHNRADEIPINRIIE